MRAVVLLAVVVGVAVEVEVAVLVAHVVGAPLTALLLVGLSAAGWSLLRRRLRGALGRLRTQGASLRTAPGGTASGGTVHGGTVYDVVAGVLLVVPGFVSAALGLLLLLPPVRWLATRLLGRTLARRVARAGVGHLMGTTTSPHPEGMRARGARLRVPGAQTVEGQVVQPGETTPPKR